MTLWRSVPGEHGGVRLSQRDEPTHGYETALSLPAACPVVGPTAESAPMIIDGRGVFGATALETEVCIIGAGVAGIAIALELDRAGVACVLLESGGESRDEATADLYRGDSDGLSYDFADGKRSRYLGGSSNCWGGFCRPWDPQAFASRSWVHGSGWPIDRQTLEPWYMQAHRVLQVDTPDYRPEHWIALSAAGADDAGAAGQRHGMGRASRRLPLDPAQVEDIVSHRSPRAKLGLVHRDALAASRHVSVLLWSNAVDFECSAWGTFVERVRVRTLSGNTFEVRAGSFVLAAGGIENARLLLASNRQHANGLGNQNDLVGRYFQDHPRFKGGVVEFAHPYRHNPLYDLKFHCVADELIIGGAKLSGQLRLPWSVQEREQLLDAQTWFYSLHVGECEETIRALQHLHQRARRQMSPVRGLGADLAAIARHPLGAAAYTVGHLSGSRRLVRSVTMEMIVEPEPDPDSRVTLSDQRDALGMRRSRVAWRLTENVKRTVDRTFELLARALHDAGVAHVRLAEPICETGWPENLEGTYHHMGTTRMHDSPRAGVVDRDCRLHGIANFYIAGSSVFPTSSSNHPTMTLTALALRLADHLIDGAWRRARQAEGPERRPDVEAEQSTPARMPAG